MLMNTLCAIALGFVLEYALGDIPIGVYPLNLLDRYLSFLDRWIKNAYADSREARNAAGGMFEFLAITPVLVLSLCIFYITYSVSDILGILVEGIMCWSALSISTPRDTAARIMNAAKTGDLNGARGYFEDLTGMDASELDMTEIVRCTVEQMSANITDYAVAPLFWMGLFGGVGGVMYRCINLADRIGGRLGGYEDNSGRIPSAFNRFASFIPARIAARFCLSDGSMLCLDAQRGSQIHRAFRNDSQNKTASQTQAACAGMLGICIDSGYPNADAMVLGEEDSPPEPTGIYWVNQLTAGAVLLSMLIIALIRVGLFVLFKYI
jgi:adenosylcobinamide-phosphate synthase